MAIDFFFVLLLSPMLYNTFKLGDSSALIPLLFCQNFHLNLLTHVNCTQTLCVAEIIANVNTIANTKILLQSIQQESDITNPRNDLGCILHSLHMLFNQSTKNKNCQEQEKFYLAVETLHANSFKKLFFFVSGLVPLYTFKYEYCQQYTLMSYYFF